MSQIIEKLPPQINKKEDNKPKENIKSKLKGEIIRRELQKRNGIKKNFTCKLLLKDKPDTVL
jgi:hypothetical protein